MQRANPRDFLAIGRDQLTSSVFNLQRELTLERSRSRMDKMDMSRFRSLQQQSAAAQLRRTLNVMFPHSYIKLYHQPPHSVCTLFSIKQSCSPSSFVTSSTYSGGDDGDKLNRPQSPGVRFEASTEPSSRAHVIQLQDQLQASLVEHQARPVGLCPIRRAIYDQCFGMCSSS